MWQNVVISLKSGSKVAKKHLYTFRDHDLNTIIYQNKKQNKNP